MHIYLKRYNYLLSNCGIIFRVSKRKRVNKIDLERFPGFDMQMIHMTRWSRCLQPVSSVWAGKLPDPRLFGRIFGEKALNVSVQRVDGFPFRSRIYRVKILAKDLGIPCKSRQAKRYEESILSSYFEVTQLLDRY